MRKIILAVPLVLSACSGLSPIQDNLTTCTEALIAANTSNTIGLLAVVAPTPACRALAQDVIQQILHAVTAHQARLGH